MIKGIILWKIQSLDSWKSEKQSVILDQEDKGVSEITNCEKKLARLLYQLMSQLAASNRKILPKVSLIRIEFTYMTRTLETVCNW